MNTKEKNEFYISMCRCCLIAQVMKNCPACNFNVGLLTEQMKQADPIPVSLPAQLAVFTMSETC